MINIIGSKEMKAFGAELDRDIHIPFVIGITFTKSTEFDDKTYIPGIVRIPKDFKIK